MELGFYLSRCAELKSLYEVVKKDFNAKGLVHHNWMHITRDLAKAILVGEAEHVEMRILLAGVLLHDIGRLYPELGKDHCKAGADVAPKYLGDAGFSNEDVGRIVHSVISYGPRGLEDPRTPEAKVGYDVEVLSCSVGFLGVAQVFDYFMKEEGVDIEAMLKMPSGVSGPRRDFYTETGEALGREGLEKARRFWKELREELLKDEKTVRDVVPEYRFDGE